MAGRHSVLLIALVLRLSTFSLTAWAQDPAEEKAKKHFTQGVAHYQDGNYEAALVEFNASYKITKNYKLLYNIGITYQALYKYVEAEAAFKELLVTGAGELPSDQVAEVNDFLLELKSAIGTINIILNVDDATLMIDGKVFGKLPAKKPIRINVGSYNVKVIKSGFVPFVVDKLDVPGDTVIDVVVDLQQAIVAAPPPPLVVPVEEKKQSPMPKAKKQKLPLPPFIVTISLSGAIGIGAGIAGAIANSKHDAFLKTPYEDTKKWHALKNEGESLQVATNVLMAVAIAGAATSGVLAIFTDFKKEKKQKVSVLPVVSDEVVGISIVAAR